MLPRHATAGSVDGGLIHAQELRSLCVGHSALSDPNHVGLGQLAVGQVGSPGG